MNEVIRNTIKFDVSIDFVLVIAVITECVKHLRELQVRQVRWYFLGLNAQSPKFDDGANGCLRFPDHRFSIKELTV